jgi:hypothetical protein
MLSRAVIHLPASCKGVEGFARVRLFALPCQGNTFLGPEELFGAFACFSSYTC